MLTSRQGSDELGRGANFIYCLSVFSSAIKSLSHRLDYWKEIGGNLTIDPSLSIYTYNFGICDEV